MSSIEQQIYKYKDEGLRVKDYKFIKEIEVINFYFLRKLIFVYVMYI